MSCARERGLHRKGKAVKRNWLVFKEFIDIITIKHYGGSNRSATKEKFYQAGKGNGVGREKGQPMDQAESGQGRKNEGRRGLPLSPQRQGLHVLQMEADIPEEEREPALGPTLPRGVRHEEGRRI